ncbi:MAG: DUF1664 domain-containing protein [Gammaproteobacteria bacterium]|nr:DUF1664 domain-containing protein [Gammaproteobacteria bacterium]
MAAWLPVLKASLPYITQIVTAALPMFTSKRGGADAAELVPQQIEELQVAVIHNAEAVKELATQLQNTIENLGSGAAELQSEMRRLRRLTVLALTFSVIGLCLAIWILASQ